MVALKMTMSELYGFVEPEAASAAPAAPAVAAGSSALVADADAGDDVDADAA